MARSSKAPAERASLLPRATRPRLLPRAQGWSGPGRALGVGWQSVLHPRQVFLSSATAGDADEQARRAFFDSAVLDCCHAKMLSAAWSNTITQSKAILGHKVLAGNLDLLNSTLEEARAFARDHQEARCTWGDTRFSYEDADKIATLWGITDTSGRAS